jgi:hypothetical protein
MGAVLWQIDGNKKVNFGVNLEFQERATVTNEAVFSKRHYRGYYRSNYAPNGYNYFDKTVEDKNLNWQLGAKVSHLRIPIMFSWKLSQAVELLVGLNRKMSSVSSS